VICCRCVSLFFGFFRLWLYKFIKLQGLLPEKCGDTLKHKKTTLLQLVLGLLFLGFIAHGTHDVPIIIGMRQPGWCCFHKRGDDK